MRQLLCRAHIAILFFYFFIVGNVNLHFFKLASDNFNKLSTFDIVFLVKFFNSKLMKLKSGYLGLAFFENGECVT